ncbi:DUF885 domain-containing protein [Actinomadura rupiterrae]|uniref:DUF885 domain-containing protein n=1 Tax=Actinomadura rupiterrae TaxID=559627 RepID=UPI0020A43A45|nr:DUF885 domain-containing protein [Actinomadura rupiterrae]MCP2343292.1 uncharacterized protein (DUF885 family) [Actinomadura rupiterrae]
MTTSLDALADRYVDQMAALDPCLAAMMGIAGQDDRLTDYSPDGDAARAELSRTTLAALDKTPLAGTDHERIAAGVLRDRLETDIALDDAGVRDEALDTTDGPLQRLRQAVELLDQGPATRWEPVLARLTALPAALTGLRTSLTAARRRGRVAAIRQIRRNIQVAHTAPAYLTDLAERYARYGGGPLAEPLTTAARDAAAALHDFATWLETDLAPHAPTRDALGRDRYTLGVRDNLGTTLDLEATYAWGWTELARIETAMADEAARIRPGATVAEVITALDHDPAHRVTGADNFRRHLQDLADRAIDDLDGTHFTIPDALRTIDCRIPPVPSGIYYLAPAEDLSRPGTVWWTVPAPDTEMITWTVPATMYHEGVPGHHLQLGATTLNTTTLNRFQRTASELHPGHCEGWGLYAERLMDELGYYRDPAHRLGMLAGGQQLRAARVVLDIGLHLQLPIPEGTGFHDGETWNADLGREFLTLHGGAMTPAEVAFEIDRYLGRPGQAIAYKLGERIWLEARDTARRRDGDAFDLKAFHQHALDLGPMGLDRLRAELTRPA